MVRPASSAAPAAKMDASQFKDRKSHSLAGAGFLSFDSNLNAGDAVRPAHRPSELSATTKVGLRREAATSGYQRISIHLHGRISSTPLL